jgi:hypothetical protein
MMADKFVLSIRADSDLFESIGKYLEHDLRLISITKLSGIDQGYWDFKIDQHQFTLHLEHYTGITIYPSGSEKHPEEQIKLIHFVVDMIRKKFNL